MKKKKNDQTLDYVKTNRRANRELEIENHGKPINPNSVHLSKKVYNRSKMKADVKRHLPSDFLGKKIKRYSVAT